MSQSRISGRYLHSLINSLRQRNIPPDELCRECNLERNTQGQVQIPEFIDTALYTRAYQHYLQQMHGEHFALSSTGETQGKYRMMCLLLSQSQQLGAGLAKAQQFYATFGSSLDSFDVLHRGDLAELRLTHPLHISNNLRPVVGANLLISILRTLELLVGRELPLTAVALQGGKPSRPEKYHSLFKLPVDFEQPHNAFLFPTSALQYPIVHTPESVVELMKEFPGKLFQPVIPADASLAEQIRNLLGHKLSKPLPSQNEVAMQLGLSSSVLRRNLAREGTNFQQLKQDVRHQSALVLLRDERLSLAEIAQQLGFPATSALHRAFKKWTGMTPGTYRETQQKSHT